MKKSYLDRNLKAFYIWLKTKLALTVTFPKYVEENPEEFKGFVQDCFEDAEDQKL